MSIAVFSLDFVAGLITGAFLVVLAHHLRERAQDRRERERRNMELRGSALKVRSEIEFNREARIKLIEKLADHGPIPRDAQEMLRGGAWEEERVQLSQLMPREGFEQVDAYYRKREKLAGVLRDYHQPTHSKNDRPALLENLRHQAEELEDSEQRAINAASKHLR